MSDIPSQPKKSGAYYGALTAVIILSALIVLALIALVVGAIRMMKPPGAAHGVPAATFTLPAGAKITGTESQPGRLILHVKGPAGEEIDIVDTASGRLVSRIAAPEK